MTEGNNGPKKPSSHAGTWWFIAAAAFSFYAFLKGCVPIFLH